MNMSRHHLKLLEEWNEDNVWVPQAETRLTTQHGNMGAVVVQTCIRYLVTDRYTAEVSYEHEAYEHIVAVYDEDEELKRLVVLTNKDTRVLIGEDVIVDESHYHPH